MSIYVSKTWCNQRHPSKRAKQPPGPSPIWVWNAAHSILCGQEDAEIQLGKRDQRDEKREANAGKGVPQIGEAKGKAKGGRYEAEDGGGKRVDRFGEETGNQEKCAENDEI